MRIFEVVMWRIQRKKAGILLIPRRFLSLQPKTPPCFTGRNLTCQTFYVNIGWKSFFESSFMHRL